MKILKVTPGQRLGNIPAWFFYGAHMVNLANILIYLPIAYDIIWLSLICAGIYLVVLYHVIFKQRIYFPLANKRFHRRPSISWRPVRTWFRKSTYLNVTVEREGDILIPFEQLSILIDNTYNELESEYDCLIHSHTIDYRFILHDIQVVYRVEFYNDSETAMVVLQHA